MSAIAPLLGDKRTQRGHNQIDVNDPKPTFGDSNPQAPNRTRL
jgi:hypothetical protein